jgi:hypothetical protein
MCIFVAADYLNAYKSKREIQDDILFVKFVYMKSKLSTIGECFNANCDGAPSCMIRKAPFLWICFPVSVCGVIGNIDVFHIVIRIRTALLLNEYDKTEQFYRSVKH